jgi:hypothetical protein
MGFKTRVWLFPLIGLTAGILLCLYAGRVYLGALVAATPPPGPAFVQLAAVYLLAGALGGVLAAITFPLVCWIGGAFVVGALALFPMYFGMGLIDGQQRNSDRLLFAAVAALAVGGTAGAREWLDEHRNAYTLLQVWGFAFVCSVIAWIVGLHWAGQWPAAVAAFVFLVPVMLALFVTLDRRSADGSDRAA